MVGHVEEPTSIGSAEYNLCTFVDCFLDLLRIFPTSDVLAYFVDETDRKVGCEVAVGLNELAQLETSTIRIRCANSEVGGGVCSGFLGADRIAQGSPLLDNL